MRAILAPRAGAGAPPSPIVRVGGAIAALLLLVALGSAALRFGGGDDDAAAPPAPLATDYPPPPAPIAAPAVPAPTATAAPPPAAPVAAAAQFRLQGVLGGSGPRASAIFARPDGSQVLVRVGRALAPGLVLETVEQASVILREGAQPVRLLLDQAGAIPVTGGGAAVRPSDAAAFQAALAPRSDGRAVTGFTLRSGAEIPLFAKARLRPGDVLVGVNGRALASPEEVARLPAEVSVSPTMVFQVERDGVVREVRVDTQ